MKRVLGSAVVLGSLLFGSVIALSGSPVVAQDATPMAADCATGTDESNIALIQSYLDALESGDTSTLDSILAEDFEADFSRDGVDVPNEAGNADELATLPSATLGFTVDNIIADSDEVVVVFTFDIDPAAVPGSTATEPITSTGIVIAKVECGEIVSLTHEIDVLKILFDSGYQLAAPGE